MIASPGREWFGAPWDGDRGAPFHRKTGWGNGEIDLRDANMRLLTVLDRHARCKLAHRGAMRLEITPGE
jgi:hypothetical protein